MHTTPLRTSIAGLALALVAMFPAVARAQVDAGPLATWNDRELTVSYRSSTNETIGTLAVVPAGPGGSEPLVILVFEARWPGRDATGLPAALEVRCYPRPLADQRIVRTVDLTFHVDTGDGRPAPLYFFGNQWGPYGFIAAGADIPLVRFQLSPPELRALVAGEAISGEATGYPFVLNAAQIDAIRAFARVANVRDIRLP